MPWPLHVTLFLNDFLYVSVFSKIVFELLSLKIFRILNANSKVQFTS